MPTKAKMLPGYVYMTAALPEDAYNQLKANCKRLHIPMTQAIGLLVGATGPHLPAIVEAQRAAAAKAVDGLVVSRQAQRQGRSRAAQ